MFKMKMKTQKNPMRLIRSSFKSGSHVMTHRLNDGMKYAAHLGHNIAKNPGLIMIANRINKKPIGTVAAVAGVGLVIFGLFNLMKK